MITEQPEFIQFLVTAKKNTYASGTAEHINSSRPGSVDLTYSEGDYLYLDSYFGGKLFLGEEVVWFEGKPAWAMNYYGRMLAEETPEGFGEFLKEALRQVSPENPYRGPRTYKRASFEYRCVNVGKLHAFSGGEEILMGGARIYELVFHGGIIE